MSVRFGHEHAFVSRREHAQRELRVFRDAPLAPAADLLERRAAQQAHRAREDDRVALVPEGHRDGEEVPVRVVARAQVTIGLVLPIVLRCLDERDAVFDEVADRRAQPLRVDFVVGVDDADDLRTWIGVLGEREVERTRLEPGPWIDVHEGDQRPVAAVVAYRLPRLRILCVVVDDDDLEVRVVDALERPDGGDQHLGRFVVGRDVQRDHRPVRGVEARRRARMPHAAGRVTALARVRGSQCQGGELEEQEPERRQARDRAQARSERGRGGEREIRQRRREECAEEHLTDRIPPPGDEDHDDAGDEQEPFG